MIEILVKGSTETKSTYSTFLHEFTFVKRFKFPAKLTSKELHFELFKCYRFILNRMFKLYRDLTDEEYYK